MPGPCKDTQSLPRCVSQQMNTLLRDVPSVTFQPSGVPEVGGNGREFRKTHYLHYIFIVVVHLHWNVVSLSDCGASICLTSQAQLFSRV